MQSRGSHHLLSGMAFRSRISTVMLSMVAAMASLHVAGRLWQDSDNRVYLTKELDRRTGQDQQKRLAAVEMELAAARHEGFVGKYNSETAQTNSSKRLLSVVGIMTDFGCKNNRDAIRKSWLPTGVARGKFEKDKGVIIRFVIGRSANRGDSMDKAIDSENSHTNDIIILDNMSRHLKTP